MESDDKKKRRERFLLDRFLEHQGTTPTSVDPGESPDFIITLDGRTVGIELTELFIQRCNSEERLLPRDPPLQAIESISVQIVSKAHEIYFDANNPPVLSHIVFSNRITPVDKRKGDQIAKLIADQIQSMSRQDSEGAVWRSRENEKEENALSEWVIFISTWKVPELRFARWSPNSAGLVSTLTPARLQEEIDKKASRISVYKKRAEDIWLLIVADRTRPSQKFSVMPNFPLDSISSPFAKTFYYGYASDEVLSFDTGCSIHSAVPSRHEGGHSTLASIPRQVR
jgi:hypothetical protein